jgi:hypothetical protein
VELAISAASNAGVETQSATEPTPIAEDAAMMRRDKPSAASKQRRKKRVPEPAKQAQDLTNTLPAAKDVGGTVDFRTDVAVLPPEHNIDLENLIVVPRSDKTIAVFGITAAYRAKALALIDTHVNAAFDYAQQLARVTSITELVEVSTNHALKNAERIVIQAAELGWLAASKFQRMTAVLTGI